jgi:hypothetical protein
MWGKPIYVSSEASPDEMESKRLELQGALIALTAEAEAKVKR